MEREKGEEQVCVSCLYVACALLIVHLYTHTCSSRTEKGEEQVCPTCMLIRRATPSYILFIITHTEREGGRGELQASAGL